MSDRQHTEYFLSFSFFWGGGNGVLVTQGAQS